jgi:effector-binding domain-containing protein
MIEPLCVTDSPAQPVAMIRLRVTPEQMQDVMGPGLNEVFGALGSQGIEPAGAWFNHHFAQPSDVFDFAICVPITGSVEPVGRVEAAVRPACSVARTRYRGPYEGLGNAWGEFTIATEAEGLTCANDFWECYVTGPESVTDQADYVTELNRPLQSSNQPEAN